jgi:predicted HTH domain antitoxin
VQTINVRQLKSNPSTALRDARSELVVVMNRDRPDAVMIGFEQLQGLADMTHVRQAMAVSLFKDRLMSVSAAAKLAGESTADMLMRLAKLGIAVADYDAATLAAEVETAAQWLAPAATH